MTTHVKQNVAVIMYQSVLLLERAGYDITKPNDDDLGKLTPWINPIAAEMKRASGVAKYGVAAVKLLHKETQREFWRKHEPTILSLVKIPASKSASMS